MRQHTAQNLLTYSILTFWHRSFTFNSNKSPTWCNSFFSLLSWRLFTAQLVLGVFPPIIRSSMTAVTASAFTFVSWWQSCSVRGWAGPTTNTARLSPRYEGKTRDCHCSHWAPDDGGKTPETCWAVNKRQDIKLKNCCIRLAIYLNCTMMHGLTNL